MEFFGAFWISALASGRKAQSGICFAQTALRNPIHGWLVAGRSQRPRETRGSCDFTRARPKNEDHFLRLPGMWFPSGAEHRTGGTVGMPTSEMASCRSTIFSRHRFREYFVPESRLALEVWNWRSSRARSPASPRSAALNQPAISLEYARKCVASPAPSSGRFLCGPELRSLPRPETIVCRCEDVTYSRLAQHGSWRASKLQTRCGMGPCQGRVCGPATRFLFAWSPDSVRPPVFPARFENLSAVACKAEAEPSQVTGGCA